MMDKGARQRRGELQERDTKTVQTGGVYARVPINRGLRG
jgi:hypothetical protein